MHLLAAFFIMEIQEQQRFADTRIEPRNLADTMDQVNRVKIYAQWQKETKVWKASSPDIWGLETEAGTLEDLEARLNKIVHDLFEINAIKGEPALIISP